MKLRWVLVAGLLALWTAGCAKDMSSLKAQLPRVGASDEERVAAVLDEVAAGMESRRIYQILAHVSSSYLDQEGRDYEAIREYLSYILRSYVEIKVTRTRPKILVLGDRARAVETFGTIAQPRDGRKDPPINLQGQVAVYLERADNTWQIVEWGPLR